MVFTIVALIDTQAFAPVEHLNNPFSYSDIHRLTIILIRYAVIMLFDLDMVIKTDFTFKPFMVYIPIFMFGLYQDRTSRL